MSYSNVVLCESLRGWSHDPEKLHIASEQIDNVFSEHDGCMLVACFSMSSSTQCLTAKISSKNGNFSGCSSLKIKSISREIAGVLADIYCGGNDDGIVINNYDNEILLEIHENQNYEE